MKDSHDRKLQTPGGTPRRSKKRLAVNITVSVLSVLLILAGTAALYANSLLSRYSYVEEEPGVSKTPIGSVNTPTEELPDPEKVDGLYHDDMVTISCCWAWTITTPTTRDAATPC